MMKECCLFRSSLILLFYEAVTRLYHDTNCARLSLIKASLQRGHFIPRGGLSAFRNKNSHGSDVVGWIHAAAFGAGWAGVVGGGFGAAAPKGNDGESKNILISSEILSTSTDSPWRSSLPS